MAFTWTQSVEQGSRITSDSISEIRSAVDTVRDRLILPQYPWSHPNLIASWAMDSTGDTRIPDYSGYNNYIDFYNIDSSNIVDGRFAEAVCINGVNQYAYAKNNHQFNDTTELTVSFWIKGSKQQTLGASIISKWGPLGNCWRIYVDDLTGRIGIDIIEDQTQSEKLYTFRGALDNLWHHIAVTFRNDFLKIFLDGSEVTNVDRRINKLCVKINSAPEHIRIGTDGNYSGYFKGTLDEIKIYNSGLESFYINQLYKFNDTVSRKVEPFSNIAKVNKLVNGNFENWTDNVPTGWAIGESTEYLAVIISDSGYIGNSRVVVYDSNGEYQYTIGYGGIGEGELSSPTGVKAHNGELYVCDFTQHKINVYDAETGVFQRTWGTRGSADGQLEAPFGIDIYNDEVYVTESAGIGNNRVSVFATNGTFIRKFGGYGLNYPFMNSPRGIAIYNNLVYVMTNRPRIQVYNLDGTAPSITTIGGLTGSADGQFSNPYGLYAHDGELYAMDNANYRVQVFNASTGAFVRKWGSSGTGEGQFGATEGITVGNGEVYVADTQRKRIQVFDTSGNFIRLWGPFNPPKVYHPGGIAVDTGPDVGQLESPRMLTTHYFEVEGAVVPTGTTENDTSYAYSGKNSLKVDTTVDETFLVTQNFSASATAKYSLKLGGRTSTGTGVIGVELIDKSDDYYYNFTTNSWQNEIYVESFNVNQIYNFFIRTNIQTRSSTSYKINIIFNGPNKIYYLDNIGIYERYGELKEIQDALDNSDDLNYCRHHNAAHDSNFKASNNLVDYESYLAQDNLTYDAEHNAGHKLADCNYHDYVYQGVYFASDNSTECTSYQATYHAEHLAQHKITHNAGNDTGVFATHYLTDYSPYNSTVNNTTDATYNSTNYSPSDCNANYLGYCGTHRSANDNTNKATDLASDNNSDNTTNYDPHYAAYYSTDDAEHNSGYNTSVQTADNSLYNTTVLSDHDTSDNITNRVSEKFSTKTAEDTSYNAQYYSPHLGVENTTVRIANLISHNSYNKTTEKTSHFPAFYLSDNNTDDDSYYATHNTSHDNSHCVSHDGAYHITDDSTHDFSNLGTHNSGHNLSTRISVMALYLTSYECSAYYYNTSS